MIFCLVTLPFALGVGIFATRVVAGPCDIYPECVAAHATTRALYAAYNGPLYQVIRASDSTTKDVTPLQAGGIANAAIQDTFCASTTCDISMIYDQSGYGNHLSRAPTGGATPGGPPTDNLALAGAAPVMLNGHKAYGVYIPPGTGYRNDATHNIPIDNNPQGIYTVLDGTHYNSACCFDYGNAELSNDDKGPGAMMAVNFNSAQGATPGANHGPWIHADLEAGLFAGNPNEVGAGNPNNPSITYRFVTAIVKGSNDNKWSLRGGNAQSGSLTTFYSGVYPVEKHGTDVINYYPMKKQGAIVLGVGGDNSDSGEGTFYEGVITSGYPTEEIEGNVQANIVSMGYTAM